MDLLSSLQNKLVLALIIIGVLAFGGYTTYVYWKGEAHVEAKQATAQLKQEVKTRKTYEKIDKATPYSAGKSESIDWLRQYGRK